MVVFVPVAKLNPAVALVIERNQLYVYVPVPPVGVEPIILDAVLPEQMVCFPVAVLSAIAGFTVTSTAALVSVQPPDVVNLLYHVVAVNIPGA